MSGLAGLIRHTHGSFGLTRDLQGHPGLCSITRLTIRRNSCWRLIDDLMRTEFCAAEDIVILSPVNDSCAASAIGRLGRYSLVPLTGSTESRSIRFGTISSFKGLEAPAVILTDIDEVGTGQAQRLFYVGISRATDRLRVLAQDGLQGTVAEILTGGMASG